MQRKRVHTKSQPAPPQIEWKGPWRSVDEGMRFQAVIGRTEIGMHAGVRVHSRGEEPTVTWAKDTYTLEAAAVRAEKLTNYFLEDRARDMENSKSYLGELEQEAQDKHLLKEGPARTPEQQEQMMGAFMREMERERWRGR